MKIRKFNENIDNDAKRAVEDSFNNVKTELDLLDYRLGFTNRDNTLDEYCLEVSKMKASFDELIQKFKEENL
jgi:hypothetical protein